MHIVGLTLPFSSAQALEAFVIFATFDFFRNLARNVFTTAPAADSKGGQVRAETMPASSQIINPAHALTVFVPPVVYMGALVSNGLRQPEWLMGFTLPSVISGAQLDPMWRALLRMGACVATLALEKLVTSSFYHLGEQWHSLGRRERPRIVQTGPYAYVRHPIYTTALLQEALSSIMFWSYIPLVALGMSVAVSLIKLPMEEDIIQRDEGMKEEYRAYMKRVPARVIPYVW